MLVFLQDIEPKFFLSLLLPLIIYSAAISMHWHTLRRCLLQVNFTLNCFSQYAHDDLLHASLQTAASDVAHAGVMITVLLMHVKCHASLFATALTHVFSSPELAKAAYVSNHLS